MAAAFGALWAGVYVGMSAFVAVLFGGFVGLAGVAIVMVVVVAVLAGIAKAATGRRRVGAAIVVTLFAGAAQAGALAHFGEIPMMWVRPGLDLVYPVVALCGAFVFGAFLGPRWVRVASAAAALATAVAAVSVLGAGSAEFDLGNGSSPEEQFARFKLRNSGTLVAEAQGFEVVRVHRAGAYTAWERTPGGGVVEIAYYDRPPEADVAAVYPCWTLRYGQMGLDSTAKVEDFADWCVPDDEGWTRTDGTGFARLRGDVYVTVKSADDVNVQFAGASRTASPAEVALALAALRPITEEEMRVAFEASNPDVQED